jgi:hypothetical protein
MYTTASHLSIFSARLSQSTHTVLYNVHFHVTIHLLLRLQSSLLSSCLPIKFMYTLISPHSCYIPRPSYPPPFHHHKTTWSLQTTQSLTVKLSPVPHYFLPLLPSFSTQFPNALNLCFSLDTKNQRYILLTITIAENTWINSNSDISCSLYMILHHAEGGWRKAKGATNQHLSCNVKTSRC